MNREEQEKLIVSTLLHYEIYKAGINGEKELEIDEDEFENMASIIISMVLDKEIKLGKNND